MSRIFCCRTERDFWVLEGIISREAAKQSHIVLNYEPNPPPLAEDPERFYRSGEKKYRFFLR